MPGWNLPSPTSSRWPHPGRCLAGHARQTTIAAMRPRPCGFCGACGRLRDEPASGVFGNAWQNPLQGRCRSVGRYCHALRQKVSPARLEIFGRTRRAKLVFETPGNLGVAAAGAGLQIELTGTPSPRRPWQHGRRFYLG